MLLDLLHPDVVIRGHTHRSRYALERHLNLRPVHVLANQQPDGRIVALSSDKRVDSIHVEGQLPRKFRLEGLHLQFDYHVASQVDMVEEEVDFSGLTGDDDFFLPADEGPSLAL